jgi:hypothetical protein
MDDRRGTSEAGRGPAMRTGQPVLGLRRILLTSNLASRQEAARLILEERFEGSVERFRRHGRGAPSLAEIANHPDSDWKKGTIYDWMRAYVFCHDVGRMDWVLGHSHLCAVLALPSQEIAVGLLKRAEAGSWSTRPLKEAVAEVCPPRRTGRKRDAPIVRALKTMTGALRTARPLGGLDALRGSHDLDREVVNRLEAVERFTRSVRDALSH